MTDTDPIILAPAPWKAKCTAYIIMIWTSGGKTGLPPKAYSPLEAASPFASDTFGPSVGGLGMVQLVRYSETPAGPYDEMILVPGRFEYPLEGKDGKKTTKKALRISRIYVSQKHTTWNGRKNWNIPKHLARFEWTEDPATGASHVKVFPHDTVTTTAPYDATERAPPADAAPFFKCTLKPIRYTPSFPFSTTMLRYMGFDTTLVQPPLPEGKEASQGELVGTGDVWCKIPAAAFRQSSSHASIMWADMNQKNDTTGEAPDEFDNFWPGQSRWTIATKLADAELIFGEGEMWTTPKSVA
ncbi:hypothetical protein B0H66DRAFT_40957 [Apodospora peruviana]|uniref:Acetoacetate decarboxylase n=1 Tax=Apodospora peruviana TaxID=516989 RepID=A0AAE0IRW2_9PEZI|nr:hypothetical protein B0H66DRAFT_40957 [Apodospora peruviana]